MTINPNSGQLIAIKHPPSPLMIIAGAGTGKTFTLQNRITYFIEKRKIKPENILAITYTEKASYELKNRIIKNVGKSAEKMTVSTFHSFCLKILRDYSDEKFPDLFEHSEAVHLLLSRFDELKPFQSDLFALNPQKAILNSILPFYSRMKDELIDIKTLSIDDLLKKKVLNLELGNQLKDLKRIYPKLQKWKKDLRVIDYGDMISLAYELIISNKSALDSIRNQYKHIIIDEFQDNNYALNTIISLIVDAQNSITVVGDDDQVIYSFRGANSYNIQNFKNKYKSDPEFKIISLEQNYRSNQPILDVANSTIKKNNDRIKKFSFPKKRKKAIFQFSSLEI